MKVKGLDSRWYNLDLSSCKMNKDRPCSSLHLRARRVLAQLFPLDRIYEEVTLPGCPTTLYADFLVPLRRLVVEVQGRQHEEFVPHFHHQDRLNFLRGQSRDRRKREFCELNGITLIALSHEETDEQWGAAIRQGIGGGVEQEAG